MLGAILAADILTHAIQSLLSHAIELIDSLILICTDMLFL